MATRIYDGEISNEYMSSSSDGEWFKVRFDEDGLANFWINSAGLSNDLDLHVYESESTDSTRLGKSSHSPGPGKDDDIIREIPVRSGRYYYVYVKNFGGGSCSYQLKAKNYPQGGGGSEFDLGIKEVLYRYADTSDDYLEVEDGMNFEVGREIKFKLPVKNYKDTDSPEYTVVVYDENGRKLDDDEEGASSGGDTDNAYLYVTVNDSGEQRLKFAIETNNGTDTDDNDNVRYRTVTFGGGSKEFDLGLKDISPTKAAPFVVGQAIVFKIEVKNYKSEVSPRYRIVLRDRNGYRLLHLDCAALESRSSTYQYLTTILREEDVADGKTKFTFSIECLDSGYTESDSRDNERIEEYDVTGIGGGACFWEADFLQEVEEDERAFGVEFAIQTMMQEIKSYPRADLEMYKKQHKAGFLRFCDKFDELVRQIEPGIRISKDNIDYSNFKEIHYFRNLLNMVPETLSDLTENEAIASEWDLMPYSKAIFHMQDTSAAPEGIFNLKFVSKGNQRFEAVYNREGILLTEKNDYKNMGTYNYVGADNKSGHVKYDVDPYYYLGNVKEEGFIGGAVANGKAALSLSKFLKNTEAKEIYNKYANDFDTEIAPMIENTLA